MVWNSAVFVECANHSAQYIVGNHINSAKSFCPDTARCVNIRTIFTFTGSLLVIDKLVIFFPLLTQHFPSNKKKISQIGSVDPEKLVMTDGQTDGQTDRQTDTPPFIV